MKVILYEYIEVCLLFGNRQLFPFVEVGVLFLSLNAENSAYGFSQFLLDFTNV